MGNIRNSPKVTLKYAGNVSSKTSKGAAVKVVQHTQPPYTELAGR
jgi:hypothetical protein